MDTGELRGPLIRVICAVLVACGLLGSCRLIFSDPGPLEIVETADALTLAWEREMADVPEGIPDGPSSVERYEVFYRRYGQREWIRLGVASRIRPRFTVSRNRLGYGEYEFAVRAIRTDGVTSNLHASTDYDAWPPGGWYLKWVPGE